MDSIGKYTIREVIGRGGMGTVYRARDTVIGRDVAIKVIAEHVASIPNVKERFYQEAVSAGRLTHEHIMTIYDVGESDGRPFLVMELLGGRDLRTTFDSGDALTFDRKILIALQICRGLAYAHAQGVVHRDIKPENIRVLSAGRLKILDFGIARVESETRTMTHSSIGTPRYMSPEQVRGKEIDHRTDIFSFGVLLYELLSGVNPFDGSHVTAVIYKILHEKPEPVKVDDEVLSDDLQQIVAGCLEKDADDRYPDFSAVIRDLENVAAKRRGDATLPIDDRRSTRGTGSAAPQEAGASETAGGRFEWSGLSSLWPSVGKNREGERDVTRPLDAAISQPKKRPRWPAAVAAIVLIALSAAAYFGLRSGSGTNSDSQTTVSATADIPVSDDLVDLGHEILQLREEMNAEKRNAEPWSETDELGGLYQEGLENELVAIAALRDKSDSSYHRAADAFRAATNAYHAVSVAGENDAATMRAEAEASRQAMNEARGQVFADRDSPSIADAFDRAEAAGRRGDNQLEDGEFTEALVAFGEAEAGFRDAARTLQQARASEAARTSAENARDAMDEQRSRVASWREEPDNVAPFQEAEELREEGLRLADADRNEEAFTHFQQAEAAYARLREPVEPATTGDVETADQTRAEMEQSKSRVADAHRSHEQYDEAVQIERRADAAYADGSFDTAADLFGRARTLYSSVAELPQPRTAEEEVQESLSQMLDLFESGLENKDPDVLNGLHRFLGAYSAMFDVAEDISADISHDDIDVSSGRATVDVSVDMNYKNRTHQMREENQSVGLVWTLEQMANGEWQIRDIARR